MRVIKFSFFVVNAVSVFAGLIVLYRIYASTGGSVPRDIGPILAVASHKELMSFALDSNKSVLGLENACQTLSIVLISIGLLNFLFFSGWTFMKTKSKACP
jgi:hypothetical protein